MTKELVKKDMLLEQFLDIWVKESLKTGPYSNGTVEFYQNIVKRIKCHPISQKELADITPENLQAFIDQLSFGGKNGDFDAREGYCRDYINKFFQ